MRYRILASWVVGLSLAGALGAIDCGGDDSNGTGTAGSAGKAGGSATGGKGGTGGSSTSSTGASGSSTGGSGGGATGGTGGATGGKGGGGAAGSSGSSGAGGAKDGSTDAPTEGATDAPQADSADGPTSDARDGSAHPDAPDGAVFFDDVTAVLQRCVSCHRPRDGGAQLLDLATPAGLYDRLTTPLPDNQEGRCGFSTEGGTEAGTDDGGDAGGDAGEGAAPPPNRQPIVPGDPGASLLYLKVAGTQPAGCGMRMPRVNVTGADGGPAGSVACDQADGGAAANCLTQRELDIILHWIEQGAPNN